MERKRVGGKFARLTAEEKALRAASTEPRKRRRKLKMPSIRQVEREANQVKELRRLVELKVAEAMPSIIAKFVEDAKTGSIPHARALATLGAFEKAEAEPVKRKPRGAAYARQLLAELNKPPLKEMKRG